MSLSGYASNRRRAGIAPSVSPIPAVQHLLTNLQIAFRKECEDFELSVRNAKDRINFYFNRLKLGDLENEHRTEAEIIDRSILDEAIFAPRPEHKLRYTVAELEKVRREREMQEGWKMLCHWKRDRWRSRE